MSKARDFDPVLTRFAADMRAKLMLPKNLAKPHWRDSDIQFLLERLDDEVHELRRAIENAYTYDRKLIRKEAADVANFAMMIADWFDPDIDQTARSR